VREALNFADAENCLRAAGRPRLQVEVETVSSVSATMFASLTVTTAGSTLRATRIGKFESRS
jgi:hypothetical protein